ncbi:hypothetical protein HanRHA438_Chr05g0207721 [Helianthus annuus]|nr:hypothetical protein HanRHA438_Chr05g0207721 [Helianthus annuus]
MISHPAELEFTVVLEPKVDESNLNDVVLPEVTTLVLHGGVDRLESFAIKMDRPKTKGEGVDGSFVLTRIGLKVLLDCPPKRTARAPTLRVVALSFDPRLAKCYIIFFGPRNDYHPRFFLVKWKWLRVSINLGEVVEFVKKK